MQGPSMAEKFRENGGLATLVVTGIGPAVGLWAVFMTFRLIF